MEIRPDEIPTDYRGHYGLRVQKIADGGIHVTCTDIKAAILEQTTENTIVISGLSGTAQMLLITALVSRNNFREITKQEVLNILADLE